jgi:hypothetical protein
MLRADHQTFDSVVTVRQVAPEVSRWVKYSPAVSVFPLGQALQNVSSRLSQHGMRTVEIGVGTPSIPERLTDAAPASHWLSALLDTTVTFIGAGSIQDPDPSSMDWSEQDTIQSMGTALAKKDGYHVVIVAGQSTTITSMAKIAALLELWSGKTLGPDFGLCSDDMGWLSPAQLPAASRVLASDRRAAETVRALYERVGTAVDFRPLVFPRTVAC